MALRIETREEGPDTVRLILIGRLDAIAADSFEAAVIPPAEKPELSVLVLELGGLEYVASAGLRVFLRLIKILSPRRARIRLIGLRPEVADVLHMTGLLSFMETDKTAEETANP